MKKLFLTFLLCWGGTCLFPLPDQKIIYPEEWPYQALTALALEQKIIFFYGSPLTIVRFKSMLNEIKEETLSPEGLALYDKLARYFHSRSILSLGAGSLNFDLDLLLQPEFYVKTNDKLEWIYHNYDRKSFLSLPVSLSFSPYINAQFEASFEQSWSAVRDPHNYTNFPTDNFSMTIPHRAYLSFGIPLPKSSGIQFRIGIGEEFIGRTRLGSIIISDTLKDLPYGAFSLYSPVLEYGARILQIDVNKYFYLHTLEARFFKVVSFAFVEGVMVNAPLEFRFLNPLMVFHSFGAWGDYGDYKGEDTHTKDSADARVGSFFAMKLEVQLFRYTRIYGIWALNELQTPGEKASEPEALRPDSFAFQAGTEWIIPAAGASWHFGVEGVYTYPFVYVSKDKRWSFYKPKNGNADSPYWTGTPFGPDSIAGTIWAGYSADSWSLTGSFLFLAQGERSKFTIFDTPDYHPVLMDSYEATLWKTPTGTPAYTYQIQFQGTWTPFPWLSLSLIPGYKVIANYDNVQDRLKHGFELALSIQIMPREVWRFETPWP